MDSRYLPFYGGMYGGANQPALYAMYNGLGNYGYGYGHGYPFGWYGGYGGYGQGYGYNYPFYGYGGYGYGYYGR